MLLASPAFQHNAALPVDYTCKGKGISPPFTISDVPAGAKSLALIMHDPDAVGGRDFLHWAVWNITPDIGDIGEGKIPVGALQGTNDYPNVSYGPACPPADTGLHHYTFELYALDTPINLPDGTDRSTLEAVLKDHIIATAQLVGTVQS